MPQPLDLPSLKKITLSGTVWIVSDMHLSPAAPRTTQVFLDFLDRARARADALLLVGDVFDSWIGDDIISPSEHAAYAYLPPTSPWRVSVCQALKRTAYAISLWLWLRHHREGRHVDASSPSATITPAWLAPILEALAHTAQTIPLWVGRGNRDFLMGTRLMARLGAQRLPELALLDTHAGRFLLTHGDELCTDDKSYQRFRKMVRDPAWQAMFLGKPLQTRLAIAQRMRATSKRLSQEKSNEIMDVNLDTVKALLRQTGTQRLIHGHTHRPDQHIGSMDIDGQQQRYERWVLPDWDYDHSHPPRGGWLVIDQHGLSRFNPI